jgi:lipoprotein-releasing system permease protein
MNTELFIARRLFFDKTGKEFLSKKIIRIALLGIALGLTVMIISVAVVTGFKKEIRNKVIGFGSHIQVVNFDSRNSYELAPISADQPFLQKLKTIHEIKSVHVFTTKPGIIKTKESIQGIVFKGVGCNYNWEFFHKNLIAGHLPQLNDSTRVKEIIISEQLSKLLKLTLGNLAILYFVNENEINPRLLQLKICGIYRTGLEEFDNLFIIGDIKQIQRLNSWKANEVSGFEIEVAHFSKINETEQQIRNATIDYSEENKNIFRTENITRMYPQIFDWLKILDMNVWVILTLMVLVAGFNMISGLLVLILERSQMIGVLKALGSRSWNIRKIFLYLAVFLTGRGMLWGNLFGVTLIFVQKIFQVIKLDPTTYYVDVVPVNFSLLHLLLINIGSITITTVMLIIPSYLVSKISPEKTIRFD